MLMGTQRRCAELQETFFFFLELQETPIFGKLSWGNSIFMSRGSNRSAGTLILMYKYKGEFFFISFI